MNKEVRKQLERAERDTEHFRVFTFTGHTFGQIECRSCGRTVKVYSTDKNAEHGAQLIKRFLDKHSKEHP